MPGLAGWWGLLLVRISNPGDGGGGGGGGDGSKW